MRAGKEELSQIGNALDDMADALRTGDTAGAETEAPR
jgi:hypothetical protein